MYIGPFYINTKEIFLILAIALLLFAIKFEWSLYWFDNRSLMYTAIAMLVTKTLIPAIQNEAFFTLGIFIIFLSLYLPFFQLLLISLIGFAFFRWLRLI